MGKTEKQSTEVGQKFLSKNGKDEGIVRGISSRYCAACGRVRSCYIVEWEDGSTTKPCVIGVVRNKDGVLQIG